MPTTKTKTIIIVANTVWYIYNFRMSLIKALINDGWNIIVVAPADDFIQFMYDLESVKVIPLHKLERKGLNPIRDFGLYRELKKIYRKAKPNVVLQCTIKPNIYGSMAAKDLNIPCISVAPGLGYAFAKKGWLRSLSMMLYRYALKENSKIIFENTRDSELFVNEKIVNQSQAVALKGSGIDTTHFHPLKPLKNGGTRKFMYMGRLIWEKGIHEFVKAATITHSKYPESRFWIIGHIDDENPSAIPNETFVGWLEHEAIKYLGFKRDVRQLIREVDCVVLPSYYREGAPRVLQEAMAMGKPIITTDSDGCREAVEDGYNGFLVESRNEIDLAQKMERICAMSHEELDQMGKNGREKAMREYDEKIPIAQYMEIIHAAYKKGQE